MPDEDFGTAFNGKFLASFEELSVGISRSHNSTKLISKCAS